MTVGPGQTIVIEGDPARHCFRIAAGTVRLYKVIADGRRLVTDFPGAGQCFGLTAPERHGCSAEAVSSTTLIRYPRRAVETAARTNPELAQALFRLACAELEQARRHMLLLGRKSADERIASFLLGLAERADRPLRNVVHLPMSRQDIADHLGLTIETVSRAMTRFRRMGLIAPIGRQDVVLRRTARLRALVDGRVSEPPAAFHPDGDARRDAMGLPLEA
ncbi:MAG TPA: helix-turn-helix domain-containing protein [Geminicoccaceae bacterium]|nr:helix-turn-helix domain-containing protein [Geminicoccaceae bacterium]